MSTVACDLFILMLYPTIRGTQRVTFDLCCDWLKGWGLVLINVPEYWKRVHSIIHDYQHMRDAGVHWHAIEFESHLLVLSPADQQVVYDRAVHISRRWQIRSQFIQPLFFSSVVLVLERFFS